MSGSGTGRPVEDFCAGLRDLQRASGLTRSALARRINYGRSQLYDILDGRIVRPPDWSRLVEPLVRACLAGRLGDRDLERSVVDWRRRHEMLLRLHDDAGPSAGAAAGPVPGASSVLLARSGRLRSRLVAHPFVRAVAAGRLSDADFRRWMVNDHYYNVEYQRFIAGLAGSAPHDAATEVLGTAISGSRLGLLEIRRLAKRSMVDLTAEPSSATVGLSAFLQAQVNRGYELSLTALYAAERAYFDTWSAVLPEADRTTAYWPLVEYWSSPAYAVWMTGLGALVDDAAPGGPTPDMQRVFDWTVRWELLFFTGLLRTEPW